jgi:hypothetical protein
MRKTPYDLQHGHPRHRCDNASVFDLAMQGDVRVIPCLSSLLTQGAVTILQLEGRISNIEYRREVTAEERKRVIGTARLLARKLAKREYDRRYRKRKALVAS